MILLLFGFTFHDNYTVYKSSLTLPESVRVLSKPDRVQPINSHYEAEPDLNLIIFFVSRVLKPDLFEWPISKLHTALQVKCNADKWESKCVRTVQATVLRDNILTCATFFFFLQSQYDLLLWHIVIITP